MTNPAPATLAAIFNETAATARRSEIRRYIRQLENEGNADELHAAGLYLYDVFGYSDLGDEAFNSFYLVTP